VDEGEKKTILSFISSEHKIVKLLENMIIISANDNKVMK